MRKTITIILLALVSAAPLMWAQGPPQPPDPATMAQHRVEFMTTLLNLTAAQQQQATTIFTSAATAQASVHQSMRTTRESLATAVKNNDTAGIDQAAATIGNLTTQMIATESKAKAAFLQTLTPDQQNKLSALESEGPGRHVGFDMGPGPVFVMRPH